MTKRFTTSDGLSLAYEDDGAGVPVLCLPGLTRSSRDFDDLAAVIGGDRRMIRLTSRGRGASDHDPNPMNYAVPIEARDALELLDHLGLDRAVLVGTSRGGIISMLLAATSKDRLAGVVLNDIGPVIDDSGLDLIMDYVGRRPTGKTYDEVAQALRSNLQDGFPDVDLARWRICAERWFVEDDQGVGLRYDPKLRDALIAQADSAPPDLWPLFDALDGIPLAVIRGANSDLLSAETVAEMARRRHDMIVAEVPNRGHVPFLDEEEAVEAIRALLAQVAP